MARKQVEDLRYKEMEFLGMVRPKQSARPQTAALPSVNRLTGYNNWMSAEDQQADIMNKRKMVQ